jgi:hypothetical protein
VSASVTGASPRSGRARPGLMTGHHAAAPPAGTEAAAGMSGVSLRPSRSSRVRSCLRQPAPGAACRCRRRQQRQQQLWMATAAKVQSVAMAQAMGSRQQ